MSNADTQYRLARVSLLTRLSVYLRADDPRLPASENDTLETILHLHRLECGSPLLNRLLPMIYDLKPMERKDTF